VICGIQADPVSTALWSHSHVYFTLFYGGCGRNVNKVIYKIYK